MLNPLESVGFFSEILIRSVIDCGRPVLMYGTPFVK